MFLGRVFRVRVYAGRVWSGLDGIFHHLDPTRDPSGSVRVRVFSGRVGSGFRFPVPIASPIYTSKKYPKAIEITMEAINELQKNLSRMPKVQK